MPSGPTKRAIKVKRILEESLGKIAGHDGNYIIKIEKSVEKRFVKLHKNDRKSFDIIVKRLKEISFDKFWTEYGATHGNNDHRSTLGKIDTHLINKIDVSGGIRIFVIRYIDPYTHLSYLMLVGFILGSERGKNDWKDELSRMMRKIGAEIFDEEEEYLEKPVEYSNYVHELNAGFLANMNTEQLFDGLKNIDPNITITYDQLSKIDSETPLLIDGHAGTGKSVIIALRIALECAAAYQNQSRKKFLLIAYNKRVVDMVRNYVIMWTKALAPDIPNHYLDIVTYETTLKLYRDLTKKLDRESIPDPNSIKSLTKLVNFYRFENQFFTTSHHERGVSAEEAWHFIRGILKGNGFGWRGEQITLNDFASLSSDGKINRRFTENMNRELIQSLIEIFNEYENWKGRNDGGKNSIDDVDLVRLASIALRAYAENGEPSEQSFKGNEYLQSFDTIFVDEAQDLTMVEFQLLNQLLHTDGPPARLVIGGDPLQTINPTGFSWDALQVFLYDLMKRKVESERMLTSHRLTNTLVNFANVIIEKRSFQLGEEPELMLPANQFKDDDSNIVVVPLDIDDVHTQNTLEGLLKILLGSSTGILVWARDHGEREELIRKDPVLSKLSNASTNHESEFETMILHSVESVKGLEYDNVIFYRFGDLGETFTSTMQLIERGVVPDYEKYPVLYHLNRLFIAATRAKKNVFILDSENSINSNWNNSWWGGLTSSTLEIREFTKTIDAEPTLDVAAMYFQEASNHLDLNKANQAFMSAKACPDSTEKFDLLSDIEILKIQLEIELGIVGDSSLKMKKERLVELYQGKGDSVKVVELRLELEQWDQIHDEILKGNLPKSRRFEFFKFISGLHVKHLSLEYLMQLIKHYRPEIENAEGELKRAYTRRINDQITHQIHQLDDASLELLPSFNFDIRRILHMLRPNWVNNSHVKNRDAAEEFRRKMTLIFGDFDEWQNTIAIEFLDILYNNPTLTENAREELTISLSVKGDKTASKRYLWRQIEETTNWNPTSPECRVYQQILNAISNGAFIDEGEFRSDIEIIKPRLQLLEDIRTSRFRDLHDATDLVRIVQGIFSSILERDLRDEISSQIPIFPSLNQATHWTNFQSNFLHIGDDVRTRLASDLISKITRTPNTLYRLNEEPSALKELVKIRVPSSQEFWKNGLKNLVQLFTRPNEECFLIYCQALDNDQSKKFPNQSLKMNFVDLVIEGLEKIPWTVIGKNIDAIESWLKNEIDQKNAEFGSFLAMYDQANRFLNDEYTLNEDEVKWLLSVAKQCGDSDIYSKISEKSGITTSDLDVTVYIKSFGLGKYEDNAALEAIKNDQEFDLQYLPWFVSGKKYRDELPEKLDQKNTSNPYIRLLSGAAFGLSLTQSLLWAELNNEEITSEPRFYEVAELIHKRVSHRCDLLTGDHEFWNIVQRKDQFLEEFRPRRNFCDLLTFQAYSVIEILLKLSKSTNPERIRFLNLTLNLGLKQSTIKGEVVDELFNTELFKSILNEKPDFYQSIIYAKAMLLGEANPSY